MTLQTVKLDRNADGTAVLTLNRPQVLNSINQQLIEELRAVIAEVARDDGMRVLVLTGAGRAALERSFLAAFLPTRATPV